MTFAALLVAVVSAGVFLGAGAVVSVSLTRVLFPAWRGSPAVVAVAMIALGWALGLGQLLGAVGGLRRAPLLAAALVSAAAVALACRRVEVATARPAEDAEGFSSPVGGSSVAETEAAAPQPALLVATVLVVALVAAVWTAATVVTARRGIYDPDSLAYHLPFATLFAQTGFADPTGFRFPTAPIQFFPANDELLSALGLVLTRSVAFAVVKNLLFGGLVLVAAHAIGKAFGAGLLSVSATAVVLGLPAVAFSQAGEAMNDTLPLLVLVGGLALLAHAGDRPAPYVLALAGAGMAYGSKYSAIIGSIAVGLLALVLLWRRLPAHRVRWGGLGVVASLAMGGSWYLRNAVVYGSPVPPTHLALGPLRLRTITTEAAEDSYSVVWYLVRGRALGQLWDGLGQGLGPLFLLVLAAALVGAVVGLRSGDGVRRGLSILAIVTAIGYVTLPGSAYGGGGNPGAGFVTNLHYAMPALVISVVAAAVALGRSRWAWAVPAVGLLVVASGLGPGRRLRGWAPPLEGAGLNVLLLAGAAGGMVAWLSTRPPRARLVRPAAAGVAALAVLGSALVFAQQPRLAETDAAQRWAARVEPTTIGGWVPAAALLAGPGSRHEVVTLTRDRSVDGGPVALDSCPAWMQAISQRAFPYVGVIPATTWQAWVQADPAFALEVDNGAVFYGIAVYRVVGQPDVTCAGRGGP